MSRWLLAIPICGMIGGLLLLDGGGGDTPGPGKDDVLSAAYAADRITQVAVLRELAQQPFDGATDDGRRKAAEWFNAQRFRNRADDFEGYTNALADAIHENKVKEFAESLEAK